jgi:exopolyphosphatase/guanosine-5'-triphosphate,3'-diphosphate pyrophosphatase
MNSGTRLAALDLGSNSFRLEIGVFNHGQIDRSEYFKETVRQGNGLDENHNLSEQAMQLGWDCLARFAERLAGFSTKHVKAVATQTLREAKNRQVFIDRAESILGFQIDVVSGREEARLIYQGVSHLLPQSSDRRLVIDIGGRSSEIILGQGMVAQAMGSYRVGSVAWSMSYFKAGKLNSDLFKTAEVAAKATLEEVGMLYPKGNWDVAYGSSGTVGAIASVLQAAGWPEGYVTAEGLNWLTDKLCCAGHVDKIKLLNLKDDRRSVIAGGLSVLKALFELLSIEKLYVAQGALRHGALYELIERDLNGNDLRAKSVTRLAKLFQVDPSQADRVSAASANLFKQLMPSISLKGLNLDNAEKTLNWAAQLHEMGCLISHEGGHKHGAYILDYVEAEGFALHEMHHLSMLVLGQRGKLKKLGDTLEDKLFAVQLICLRLAVIFCHARREIDLEGVSLSLSGKSNNHFLLTLPSSWPKKLPQTFYLLNEELIYWSKGGSTFNFRT